MFKTKNLLIIKLSQIGTQCISVKGNSTEKNILIESKSTITFNEPELGTNHIFQTASIIEGIQKQRSYHDMIAWVLDETLIQSCIIEQGKEAPKNDTRTATMQYYRNDNSNVYCDTISQALLLQIRLIAYRLECYCLNPVSQFYVLSHIYYNHLFNKKNENRDTPSAGALRNVFNYKTVQKILHLQKNIDQQNYQIYILVYGLLTMYSRQWNNDEQ